ncbi:MAG: extracellular solute-binding protein [Deltaproteobacteria bacterium]|nr:extracellular solute-binding protein [Deltaproteobacteria bacterium]
MKRLGFLGSLLIVLFLAWTESLLAARLDELVAAAKKDGTIEFYAPSTLTPKGAQELADVFNKKYGLAIKVNYHSAGTMAKDVSKTVGQAAAGVPPEWDLMVVTDAHHATLWVRKLHQPFDYGNLGVDAKAIDYDKGTITIASQIVLPAYNTKLTQSADVPKRWEDLLDPKWKGGKLGVTDATHHLARLATGTWGEKKTLEFVKALAAQEPIIGAMGTISSRLQLGEVLVSVTQHDGFINRAQKAGAPVAFAKDIQPAISPALQAGVLKGAAHPNAAFLFAVFLTTPAAQESWEKYTGQASAFVPGTSAHSFFKGKKVLHMTQEQAQTVDRLAREYGKILGFK